MLKPKEKYKFTNAKYSIDMNKENKIFDILLKDYKMEKDIANITMSTNIGLLVVCVSAT